MAGLGIVLYAWLWLTVPIGDPHAVAAEQRDATTAPLRRGLTAPWRETVARLPITDIAIGAVLVAAAVALIAARTGKDVAPWLLPLLVLLAGAGLGWSQLDAVQRGRWAPSPGGRTPVSIVRIVAGVALAVVGTVLLVAGQRGPEELLTAAVPMLAVVAGAALVLAPWWLRLVRELGEERAARARESERADIAAHLHDSVLQTLAMIRSRATDAEAVSRLARAQERELRQWLYRDRATGAASLAAAVREAASEIEDTTGAELDVVVVGDLAPENGAAPQIDALLRALREAMINAVRHGAPPISVYVEVQPEQVLAFVRDRGGGFDPAAVERDRLGVRESIIGRIRRRGGHVTIHSNAQRGTEIEIQIPTRIREGS